MQNKHPIIDAIVLAAGGSTRFGAPKQLIEHAGISLVRRAALATLEAGARKVIVVLGADRDRIRPVLEGIPDLRIAVNNRWREGLSSSLATGLSELAQNPETDGALIVLADQPLVDANALGKLVNAFGEHRIVASAYSGTIGVPAIIGREHFDELSQLVGDRGAGQWIGSRGHDVTALPLSEPALDVDTPADLATLRSISPKPT